MNHTLDPPVGSLSNTQKGKRGFPKLTVQDTWNRMYSLQQLRFSERGIHTGGRGPEDEAEAFVDTVFLTQVPGRPRQKVNPSASQLLRQPGPFNHGLKHSHPPPGRVTDLKEAKLLA